MRLKPALPSLALILIPCVFACFSAESPTSDVVVTTAGLCSIPQSEIFDGGPGKDGIPALNDAELVDAQSTELGFLTPTSRVIGLIVEGQPIAVPLNVGWWHEIINLDYQGRTLAITHCPLTGSSLAFDRNVIGGATFGVSGLLYRNNLIMYDRTTLESFWPQMARAARCGARDGTALTMHPVIEMTWAGWSALYHNTLVVAGDARLDRNYELYPYGSYDQLDNESLLFPIPDVDRRRPLKERVLGIPTVGTDGVAFPFEALEDLGDVAVVTYQPTGAEAIVVLWNGFSRAAAAFRPNVDGVRLDLAVDGAFIVDAQTGSHWSVDGMSRSGELSGKRLEPINEAYVAYWFAWASFNPNATLWTAISP